MTPADRIIGKFGSIRRLARELGHKNPSTVQGWKESGLIPLRHAADIVKVGASLPDPIVPTDFLPELEPADAA